jgi:hypothetical protein
MYEKNLILLEWNLRHRRMLDSAWTSALGKSDAEVHAMLADTANTMALSPKALVVPKIEQVEKVSVTPLSGMAGPAPDNYLLRGAATVLIYPQGDDEIVIQPRRIAERGEMVRYRVIDSVGKAIVSGVLSQHEPIRFFGNEKQPYFMKIQARSASYQLELRGTPWAIRIGDEGDHKALHLLQHTTPVYFQVPTGLRQFTMTLSSASPGETASAEVVSASGKVAARFDTSEVPADRQSVSVDQPGTWMVRFVPPRAGSVDDVYLSFDEPISPWASLDPRWLLQVSPVK